MLTSVVNVIELACDGNKTKPDNVTLVQRIKEERAKLEKPRAAGCWTDENLEVAEGKVATQKGTLDDTGAALKKLASKGP